MIHRSGITRETSCCIQRSPHFGCNRGVPLGPCLRGLSSTVNRGGLITGGWNGGVPLYIEVSSSQGVGIEGFHCRRWRPHFRVLE